MRILATLPSVDTSDFRGSFTELLVSCLTKTARGNTKEYFGFEVTTHAIAVRDRALHARPSSPRTRSHRSSRHERAGTFRAASTHTCAGRWGPLPARPREIRAGTFVSARPSRPSSRGTPCPRGTRTRRSRSRGSRTTPRRGTTARYARTRPRSRRRTPREPRDARVSRKRVTAWCFFLLDSRFGSVLSNAHSAASGWSRGRYFSTPPPSRAPSFLSARLFLFTKKNVSVSPTDRVTNVHHLYVHARMNTRHRSLPLNKRLTFRRSARRARRRFATT